MSSLTLDALAETARNRLNLPPNDVPRLKTLVNGALQSLANKVARRGDRALLVVEIDATPSGGKIDLSDSDFDAILIDTYRMEGAIRADGFVFQHASSFQKLQASMPRDETYVWYSLRDRALVFRHPVTGALDTFATPVHLAGSRVPTLANMPDVYDDEIAAEVVKLAQGKDDAVKINLGGPQA